jgi:RNA polymerase sigma-70 factor (ECF subfamily)
MDYAASLVRPLDAATTADFDAIVQLYRPRVFRFLLASLRDRDAAENLTQDCFLKAFKAHDRFRSDCKVSTWLLQIAVNSLRDYTKNRRLQFWRHLGCKTKSPQEDVLACIADQQKSPEAQALLREQVDAIWAAAATLPRQQQTVFLLRFVEDMDVAEIAIATGLKPATIKTHLLRALSSVRQRLGASL